MTVFVDRDPTPLPFALPAAHGPAPRAAAVSFSICGPPPRPRVPQPRRFERAADADLVAAMAVGDGSALGELYDRHAGLMNALAQRVTGSRQDAEEVVQEVFFTAWKQAAGYDPARATVATWLGMMTRSRALDRVRHRAFVHRTRDRYRAEAATSEHGGEGYARTLDRQRVRRVRAALAALPDEQVQVLELAYYRGLTQSEISERLGLPLGTVKTRTLLALRKLRRDLAEELAALV